MRPKVAYLFTRFPVLSETFLQREIQAMEKLGLDFSIYSIWKTKADKPSQISHSITQYPFSKLLKLSWRWPLALIRNPDVFNTLFTHLLNASFPNLLNLGENLWGFAFAINEAPRFRKKKYTHLHAVWSSMPAASAFLLRELNHTPYSFAGHAYDLFEGGGDGLLQLKCQKASWVRTSTSQGKKRFIEFGLAPHKIHWIKRGILNKPPPKKDNHSSSPIKFLSIGRLVPKKDIYFQLALYRKLKTLGIPFEATLIGDGPERTNLLATRKRLRLESEVSFLGELPFEKVCEHYRKNDFFLFTGSPGENGDVDGLPNVIPEAMAHGLLVISTLTGSVTDAIKDNETGIHIPRNIDHACQKILSLALSPNQQSIIRTAARAWVDHHFDALKNANALKKLFF